MPPTRRVDPQSTEIEPLRVRAPHKPEHVDAALLAMALVGGSSVAASRLLAEQGINVPRETLKQWRHDRYPNRYRDICARHKAAIEGEIVTTVRELALRASHVAHKALELEEQRIIEGKTVDASAALRNIATSIGISLDKVMLLEGRPTQITEQRSSDDVLRGLQAKGYVDSTAVEEDAAA